MECPVCGMILEDHGVRHCPKCDYVLGNCFRDTLYIVDIAHSDEDRYDAEKKLREALQFARSKKYKGLKVIHGRGSDKHHTHLIKDMTLKFLYKWENKLKGKLVRDKHSAGGAYILFFN